MSWKVADANYLRTESLAEFLRESPSHRVVLSEYTGIESYQGDPLQNIAKTVSVVRDFPRQVIVLKGALELVAVQDKTGAKLSRSDFVDERQTAGFARFCQRIEAATNGDADAIASVRAHGAAAAQLLSERQAGAEKLIEGIKLLAAELSPDQLKRIRTDAPLSSDDADHFHKSVLTMTALFVKDHPSTTRMPEWDELPGYMLFRYAQAGYLLMRRWIRDGGVESVARRKVVNDVADMVHLTYATYFDGLLSMDRKLTEL